MFWQSTDVVQWLSPQMPQMRDVRKCVSRGSMPFMKMSTPRKIIDVEKHLLTFWLSKSISVWMPREPTMRVIGSHDISRTPVLALVPCVSMVAIALLLYQRFAYPVVSSGRLWRHSGSLSYLRLMFRWRPQRRIGPY